MSKLASPNPKGAKRRANPKAKRFALEHSPFYLIAQVEGVYQQAMERSLKAVGMDIPRWRVLMLLHEQSPRTVSDIAAGAVMKLSTMTRVAQRLAGEGFVSLAANREDARSTDVHLSDQGAEAVVTIRAVAARIYEHATTELGDDEVAELVRLLKQMRQSLTEY